MKKPIIGIVGRSRVTDTGYNLIATPESERMAVITFGGNPILILPPQLIEYERCLNEHPTPGELKRLTKEELQLIYDQINLCDGIVLPGGDMMFEYDRIICEYCLNNNIPILGICMGMQVMCTYDRSVSLNKINSDIEHKDLKSTYVHKILINENSKLFSIVQEKEIKVNSRHGLAVNDSGLSTISSKSEDNIIESVEFPDKEYALGVQWHPELDFETDIFGQRIWESFISTCKR